MSTTIVNRFPFEVVRTRNEWIALADGTRLAARLWRPDTEEAVPAILEYLPYRKGDSMAPRDEGLGTWFAGHGYAYVRVDIRGTGDSDGVITDEYTPQEHDDALEVIARLADAPWCSGAVGMVGISWGGFNGLQVAARRPPALKAVISLCSTDDRYADDVHYKGGCVLACDALPWASVMLAYNALPPDPATVGDAWKETWLARLEETPPFITEWLTHQHRDDYWKHGSIGEDYGAIECPVYMVGGWADGYTNAIPRTLEGLPGVRKGLIGPWPHAWPHVATQGPRIDFLGEALRWWDRWLKGTPNGIEHEPMLHAWMQEPASAGELHLDRPGRWVSEPAWPAPSVSAQRFSLAGDGSLSALPSDDEELRHTGAQHHGLLAGVWCPYGQKTDFPLDQGEEDALCLTFDTAPLHERMELLGHPRLRLTLSVDRPLAFVIARLCRLAPDGSSTSLSRGALDLSHRDSHERPEPLEPGTRYEVDIELDALGQAVAAGDRLRLAISTTYWPWLWPSPEEVELSLVAGAGSWIDLPGALTGSGRWATTGFRAATVGTRLADRGDRPGGTLPHDRARWQRVRAEYRSGGRSSVPASRRAQDHGARAGSLHDPPGRPAVGTGRVRPRSGARTRRLEGRGSDAERDDRRSGRVPTPRHHRGLRSGPPHLRTNVGPLHPANPGVINTTT